MTKQIAYIGTWDSDIHVAHEGDAATVEGGIKTFHVDEAGHFAQIANASPEVNAGILCISPDKRFLYATDERKDAGGVQGDGGRVCAYSIDPEDGHLTFLNAVSSAGAFPCYIAIDPKQKYLYVANHANHEDVVTRSYRTPEGTYRAARAFDEGSVGMFPLLPDGRVGECNDLKVLSGSSVKEWFQWTPHPHSVKVDPSGTFLLSADKGSDQIYVWRIDYENGRLEEVHCEKAPAGSGPRHIAFHPSWPMVYINSELDSTVHAYAFNFATGQMQHKGEAKTIPQPYVPPDPSDHFAENATADIRVHKSGKYLYVSNRGHNSIAAFALAETGEIQPLERVPSGGQIPRAINFDLSGDVIYAVNQRTGEVAQFTADENTGALAATGYQLQLSNPVCLEFLQL